MTSYGMQAFGHQAIALLDHLEVDQAVIGGTSLGANATLEAAAAAPERVRGLLVEMPVLDNALLGAALAFTPVLLALRFARPVLSALAAVTRRIPRTHYLVDTGLDWLRQDPAPSSAVLEGILFHRTAPPRSERLEISEPALVIGHPSDPLHPFSDAGMLVEEMPNARLIDANSILEWRLTPNRLDDLLAEFLAEAYAESPERAARKAARRAA
jgi:pimeloyl-ACP methyl ester carboxylesterase